MNVELIDCMGSDLTVVNAARVSFANEGIWEPSTEDDNQPNPGFLVSEKDVRLINYLAGHNHWTPFAHIMVTMRETVPLFVARQRFKHMIGFVYNEISRRYVDSTPVFYFPAAWRSRPEGSIKQGSGSPIEGDEQQEINTAYSQFIDHVRDFYDDLIDRGVCPEQARMVLPQSMFTSYYVTGSLVAFARAYKLRADPTAQHEIQELAEKWNLILSGLPQLEHSWKALING